MKLYPIIKPLLFRLEAEKAHNLVLSGLALGARIPGVLALIRRVYAFEHPALQVKLLGLDFQSPVGLAAGLDKNAKVLAPLEALGFGLLEAGTVTPRPQPGNRRPRLFRLVPEQALINRMGFNNAGVFHMAQKLEKTRMVPGENQRHKTVLGVNLGKNKETPLDLASTDYLRAMHGVYAHADYLVMNLSSPNTPGLRGLQEANNLAELARIMVAERNKLAATTGSKTPFFIKIAPDMEQEALKELVAVVKKAGVDGLVATNTTLLRKGLSTPLSSQAGGLSGALLQTESRRTVAELYKLTKGKLPIIGVGGISSAEDAYALIRAGASLVQLYSGLIYQGPSLVKQIKQGLVTLLENDGLKNISEAVGLDAGRD